MRKVNGKIALGLVVGGAVAVLIIFLIILCCCIKCCCCRGNRYSNRTPLREFSRFKGSQNSEEESLISKHPKTDSRRAELMKKYGSKLSSNTTSARDVDNP